MSESWYYRGTSDCVNRNFPGYRWWLQCNKCGWKLEDGAAGKCPECGSSLNIHSNGAPYCRIFPKEEVDAVPRT